MSTIAERREAVVAFLAEWTGTDPTRWPEGGDSGSAHAGNCAGYSEGQGCCLDSTHVLFDQLVDGLAAATA